MAHTADDQVETVLMHLLRGAGLAGLKGMLWRALPNPWSGTIPLVRPLLAFWRDEVMAYLHENQLTALIDPTNQVPDFYRNRLRLEVVPYLESVKPGFRQAIIRMASVISADDDILKDLQSKGWDECLICQGEGYVAYDLPFLVTQPVGMQRRLLREGMRRQGRPTAALVREAVAEYARRHAPAVVPRSVGAARTRRGNLSERAEALLDGMGREA